MEKQPTEQNTDVDTTYTLHTLHDGIENVGDRMTGLSPDRLDGWMAKLICSVNALDFNIVAPLFHTLLGEFGVSLRFEIFTVHVKDGPWIVLSDGDFHGVQSCGPAREGEGEGEGEEEEEEEGEGEEEEGEEMKVNL